MMPPPFARRDVSITAVLEIEATMLALLNYIVSNSISSDALMHSLGGLST